MMRLFTVLVFGLVAITSYAQTSISYLQDKGETQTFQTINNAKFEPYTHVINNGMNNGVYWFKIIAKSKNPLLVQIANDHLADVTVYQDGKKIENASYFQFYNYKINPNGSPVYVKLNAIKAAKIPVSIFQQASFEKEYQKQLFTTSFFYGFGLMVLLVNLFYFFSFKDTTFLLYALFLTTVLFTFAFRDGTLLLFGFDHHFIIKYESLDHAIGAICCVLFASYYLSLKKWLPKLIYIIIFFAGGALFFSVLYINNGQFIYSAITDVFVYLTFLCCWFASIYLFKKNSYAAIFCVAYLFLMLFITDFYLLPIFGINGFGITLNTLKLGGYAEMVIISFGVVRRMQLLHHENKLMHDAIYKYVSQVNGLEKELEKLSNNENNTFSDLDLTPREVEILNAISRQKTNQEIAEQLFISVNTVKYHLKKIYFKLDSTTRYEALENAKKLKVF